MIVRILLKLLGANEASQFAIFWYDLSSYFVGFFEGIFPMISPVESNFIFETHSIIALIVYSLIAGIMAKSITSIGASSNYNRAKEVLDLVFKILEFLLISRFVLKLTGASTEAGFTQFIYSSSDIVHRPFAGIFPVYELGGNGEFVLEISTLIAIIIVVIFDVVSDILIRTLKKSETPSLPSAKIEEPSVPVQNFAPPVDTSQPNQFTQSSWSNQSGYPNQQTNTAPVPGTFVYVPQSSPVSVPVSRGMPPAVMPQSNAPTEPMPPTGATLQASYTQPSDNIQPHISPGSVNIEPEGNSAKLPVSP